MLVGVLADFTVGALKSSFSNGAVVKLGEHHEIVKETLFGAHNRVNGPKVTQVSDGIWKLLSVFGCACLPRA